MSRRHQSSPTLVALLALFTLTGVACSASVRGRTPYLQRSVTTPIQFTAPASAPAMEQQASKPAEDPVLPLLPHPDRHFKAGQNELEQGHFEGAKQEFNRSIQVLLESPHGARSEPRVREFFDRLVDRISAYEVRALAEGDGFTEKKYEAASIDELLAVSTTFGTLAPTPELKNAVTSDTTDHDIPIPLNRRVLSYIELFQGRLHDFIEDGMKRGSKYLPMIQSVFRAEGLPMDLAYVPLIERAFTPNALSRVKAKGVWQFMTG